MPVKTVTILVQAMTDRANAQMRATGAIFDELRARSPLEMQVKLDKAQALAESRIFARELSRTIREATKLQVTAGDQGVFSLLKGAFTGGGGAAGGAAGTGGGIVSAFGKLPPVVQGGLGVTALGVLPLIAQAAAGMITFGLGSALTGLGVYAEKGVRSVQVQFAGLQADVSKTFTNLSPAFGQALTTILSAARTFVPQLIRDFKPALDAIAGPLKSLGVMIAGSLASPAIAGAIRTLGQAFGLMLKAITPQVPGDINAIANGFTALFKSATSPQALKAEAGFVFFLAHAAAGALQVIAALSNVAGWIEKNWKWDQWFLVPEVAVTAAFIRNLGNLRQWIYDDFILKIEGFFTHLGPVLKTLGSAALQLFLDGARNLWNTVMGFFSNLGTSILHAVEHILGIHSPSSAFFGVGVNIMRGLLAGLKSESGRLLGWMENLAGSALTKITSLATGGGGSITGTAAQNLVLMQQMAKARGWFGDQWTALYNVEMAEAGFSMTARNPGSGAYGMAQFIGGPSEYFTWGGNPFTAAGQITGMLNYIASRYGSPAGAWAHEQAFHWYGSGLQGIATAPTLIGVGERGPEYVSVTPLGGGHGTGRVEKKLDALTDAVRENTNVLGGLLASIDGNTAAAPGMTGAALGAALGMGARSATYRSLYP